MGLLSLFQKWEKGNFSFAATSFLLKSIFKTKLPSNIQNHKKIVQQYVERAEHPIQKQQIHFIYLWVNIQNQKLLLKILGLVHFLLHLPSYLPLPHTEAAVQPHVLASHVRSCLGNIRVRTKAPHFYFVK